MELGTQKFPRTQRRDEAERLSLVADAKKRMIGVSICICDAPSGGAHVLLLASFYAAAVAVRTAAWGFSQPCFQQRQTCLTAAMMPHCAALW